MLQCKHTDVKLNITQGGVCDRQRSHPNYCSRTVGLVRKACRVASAVELQLTKLKKNRGLTKYFQAKHMNGKYQLSRPISSLGVATRSKKEGVKTQEKTWQIKISHH